MNERHSEETIADRIDAACDAFERGWKEGHGAALMEVLTEWPEEERTRVLEELLPIELHYRRRRGETPSLEEYGRRFPDLSATLAGLFPDDSQDDDAVAQETFGAADGPDVSSDTDPESNPDQTLAEDALSLPDRIGDYQILGELARGGMGIVFRARQLSLNRPVALKMVRPGSLGSQQEVERFRIEAEAAGRLDHPNIVPIYEVGEFEGQPFFSMRLIEGGDLRDRVAKALLDCREAALLIRSVAAGVQFAHSRNIVHRDLKPGNILLDESGQPLVTDFGLAKDIDSDSDLTATGQVMGTPSYMAPEQAAGRTAEIGPLADVYALGALLYYLVTGRPPFQGKTVVETLRDVMDREPTPPQALRPDVDLDLSTICLKCLEKDPARRYASAAELARELDRYLSGRPISSRPIGRIERGRRWVKRNPVVAGLAVLSVLLLVGGTVVSSYFAVDAAERAENELALRGEAELREQEAIDARVEAETAETREYEARLDEAAAHDLALRRQREAQWNVYVARMQAMTAAWNDGNIGHVERLLAESIPEPDEPDFRGWEWYCLQNLVQSASRSLGEFDSNKVVDLHWLRDTGVIALTSIDQILLLNPDDGSVTQSLELTQKLAPSSHAGWSPTEDRVSLSAAAGLVHVLRWPSLDEINTFTPFPGIPDGRSEFWRMRSFTAWSPDGERLAICTMGGDIGVWDGNNGELLNILVEPAQDRQTWDMAWHPDGELLAVTHAKGRVAVWNTLSGELAWEGGSGGAPAMAAAWSPDGERLAFGTDRVAVRGTRGDVVWDEPGDLLHARRLAWLDEDRFVAAGHNNSLTIWDVPARQQVNRLQIAASPIHFMSLSPDGSEVVTLSTDGRMRRTALNHSPNAGRVLGGDQPCRFKVAWSPDGSLIASARLGTETPSMVSDIVIIDVETGDQIAVLKGHARNIFSLSWSPDGTKFVSTGDFGELIVRDASSWEILYQETEITTFYGFRAVWSPTGRYLLATSLSGRHLFDTEDLQREPGSVDSAAKSISWSSDEREIAVGDNYTLKIIDVESRDVLNSRRIDGLFGDLAHSSDDRMIALARPDGRIEFVDAESLYSVNFAEGHVGPVLDLSFSPDGLRLASVGDRVRIWDTQTASELLSFAPPGANKGRDVHWSPDGRTLAVGWSAAPPSLYVIPIDADPAPARPEGGALFNWSQFVAELDGQSLDDRILQARRLAENRGDDTKVWSRLGGLYAAAVRYSDAVPCFDRALELGHPTWQLYAQRAEARYQCGETQGAAEDYWRSWKLSGTLPSGQEEASICWVLLAAARGADDRIYYSMRQDGFRILRRDDNIEGGTLTLTLHGMSTEDFQLVREYSSANETDPNALAWIAVRDNEVETALRHLEVAEDKPLTRFQRTIALARLHRHEEARAEFDEGLQQLDVTESPFTGDRRIPPAEQLDWHGAFIFRDLAASWLRIELPAETNGP